MKKLVPDTLMLLSLLLLCLPALAGVNQWTSNGPFGGIIYYIAIDTQNPSTLYAAVGGGGVYKSTDGGASWASANSGLTNLNVSVLAVDPSAPATVYAGTYKGVFKSTNAGISWVLNDDGLSNKYLNTLAIDPQNTSTLYAGTLGDGIFKSTDGGTSWAPANSGLSNVDILTLAIDPQNTSTLYAGTGGDGIFQSSNGGASWLPANSGIESVYVYAIAIAPQTTTTLYAGTDGDGIFKSVDAGATWVAVNNGLTDTHIISIAIDPQGTSTLYAGSYIAGVFKSTDGGTSWAPSSSGLVGTSIYVLVVDPQNTSTLYAGFEGGGVFKSTDGGASWYSSSVGINNTIVLTIVIDPQTPEVLYAGTWGAGIFKSVDSGATWGAVNNGLTNPSISTLATDPNSTSTLYAGSHGGGVFKSTDGGISWMTVNNGMANLNLNTLAIDPQSTANVYAGTLGGVFKSTDAGGSWVSANNGLSSNHINILAIDPSAPANIFAGTPAGAFKSSDGGNSWSLLNNGLPASNISVFEIAPSAPANIYAGAYGKGLFKSTDGGASWVLLSTSPYTYSFAIDPQSHSSIYSWVWDTGISKSADGGESWTMMNTGAERQQAQCFAIDPQNAAIIYAGFYGYGVSSAIQVQPTVTGISPDSGCDATEVTVSGEHFSGAYLVRFGGTPAESFTVISDTEIAAHSPGHSWSGSDVRVAVFGNFTSPGPGSSFTLVPNPMGEIILFENFEEWPPAGGGEWTFLPATAPCNWSSRAWESTECTHYMNQTGGEGFAAEANSDWWGDGGQAEMITPAFSLLGTENATLNYDTCFNVFSANDSADVDITTDGGVSWTNIEHFVGERVGPIVHRSIPLTAFQGYPAVQIRFRYYADGYNWYWQVDNVMVSGQVGSISGDGIGCTYPGVLLTSLPFESYQWQRDGADIPGATSRQHTAAVPGDYTVRVSDAAGCTWLSLAKAVTLLANPSVSINGPASACQSPGATLSTDAYSSYQWLRDGSPIAGATGRNCIATQSGTYSVAVTDEHGCAGTSPVFPFTALVNPVPVIGGPNPACQSGVLSTGTYSSYQWYRNSTPITWATNRSYSAPAPGTYTVRVTDSSGCEGTSAGFIVGSYPSPAVSGPSSGCTDVPLSTGLYAAYQWNIGGIPIPGATNQGYGATASGSYSVTVTNSAGCSGTSPAKAVTILGTPNPAVSGDQFNICPATSVTLNSSGYLSYQWNIYGEPVTGATSESYAAGLSGIYTVTVTDSNGCEGTSSNYQVFIDFCPNSEVSPAGAIIPARLVKSGASGTGYYLFFQRIDTLDGYNLYEGDIGEWYSHANSPGNRCGLSATDLGTGEMRAEITPSSGNRYYLVTAFGGGAEGPSGFRSSGAEIDPAQSTCPQ